MIVNLKEIFLFKTWFVINKVKYHLVLLQGEIHCLPQHALPTATWPPDSA